MIKDVLLVCALVLCVVLLYRIFVVSQKINNLEEKFVVLDNFSQTLFNYISNKEESPLSNEITYSNNTPNVNTSPVQMPMQMPLQMPMQMPLQMPVQMPLQNNIPFDINNLNNNYNETSETSETKETENFETKEILSDMVSQLKNSIIDTSKEELTNDLNDVSELKQEFEELIDVEDKPNNNLVINLSSISDDVTQLINENSPVSNNKKKEDDLMKLSVKQLKDLAKAKNIPLFNGRVSKNKNVLVQDIMKAQ
jgi:hypothetical protein